MTFWNRRNAKLGKHRHLPGDVIPDDGTLTDGDVFQIVAGQQAFAAGGVQPILKATTILTDVDIKTLKTAKVIVPDPGAGKFIDFISITIAEKTPNAAAYVTLASTAALLIELGQMQVAYVRNDAVFDGGMLTDLFDASGGTIIVRPGIDIGANGSGTGQPIGTYAPNDITGALALRLDQTNNLTGGDATNTLTVVVVYAVIDLP